MNPSIHAHIYFYRHYGFSFHGSDKEASVRNSENPFYKQMAADFSKFQISVSLYAFANSYIDLASLGWSQCWLFKNKIPLHNVD